MCNDILSKDPARGVTHQIGGGPLPEAQEVEAESLAVGVEWLLSCLAHNGQASESF